MSACEECGNDEACQGQRYCLDCLEADRATLPDVRGDTEEERAGAAVRDLLMDRER
jgi:hypothetical protein